MKWVYTGVFFLALTTTALAQEFNAGFVQGLWYGDKTIFAEKETQIYVAIRNNTGAELTGRVEFFDNGDLIERNNVSALDGRIIESWADWTPSFGEHTITATLSRIEVGAGTEAVEVTSSLAEDILFVDYDTDDDGIGNEDDTDDDGDGISDKDEKENNTDPLDADDPGEVKEKDTEESDSSDTDDDQGEEEEEENTTPDNSNSDDPEGLEQFIGDGRTDSTLSSITDAVNTTKRKLDIYRDNRNANSPEATIDKPPIVSQIKPAGLEEPPDTPNNEELTGTFGTITRTQNEDTDGNGFFATMLNLAKVLLDSAYTFTLFALSLYLSHPIIVQLTLLFLILFIIYKLAKKLGNRNNY